MIRAAVAVALLILPASPIALAINPGPTASIELDVPAPRDGLSPAVRLDPPPPPEPTGLHGLPFAPPGLSDCDEMRFYRVQAGLPARFDALAWRESNCRNEEGVHTGCCWGYWQLWVSLHLSDPRIGPRYRACEISSRFDVDSDSPLDKQRQACAARALFDVKGFQPWG